MDLRRAQQEVGESSFKADSSMKKVLQDKKGTFADNVLVIFLGHMMVWFLAIFVKIIWKIEPQNGGWKYYVKSLFYPILPFALLVITSSEIMLLSMLQF